MTSSLVADVKFKPVSSTQDLYYTLFQYLSKMTQLRFYLTDELDIVVSMAALIFIGTTGNTTSVSIS